MTLRDRVNAQDRPRAPWKVCSVCWLRERLPDDERDALDQMLADPDRWSVRELEDILRIEFDVVIGVDSVGKHRRNRHAESSA